MPLVALAGSRTIGDDAFNEIFHPMAVRLQEKCDAVLRVGGASAGADEMVRVGESLGLKIYRALEEIPGRRERVTEQSPAPERNRCPQSGFDGRNQEHWCYKESQSNLNVA